MFHIDRIPRAIQSLLLLLSPLRASRCANVHDHDLRLKSSSSSSGFPGSDDACAQSLAFSAFVSMHYGNRISMFRAASRCLANSRSFSCPFTQSTHLIVVGVFPAASCRLVGRPLPSPPPVLQPQLPESSIPYPSAFLFVAAPTLPLLLEVWFAAFPLSSSIHSSNVTSLSIHSFASVESLHVPDTAGLTFRPPVLAMFFNFCEHLISLEASHVQLLLFHWLSSLRPLHQFNGVLEDLLDSWTFYCFCGLHQRCLRVFFPRALHCSFLLHMASTPFRSSPTALGASLSRASPDTALQTRNCSVCTLSTQGNVPQLLQVFSVVFILRHHFAPEALTVHFILELSRIQVLSPAFSRLFSRSECRTKIESLSPRFHCYSNCTLDCSRRPFRDPSFIARKMLHDSIRLAGAGASS